MGEKKLKDFFLRLLVEDVSFTFTKSEVPGMSKVRFAKLLKDNEGVERYFYNETNVQADMFNMLDATNEQLIKLLNKLLDNYLYYCDMETEE